MKRDELMRRIRLLTFFLDADPDNTLFFQDIEQYHEYYQLLIRQLPAGSMATPFFDILEDLEASA